MCERERERERERETWDRKHKKIQDKIVMSQTNRRKTTFFEPTRKTARIMAAPTTQPAIQALNFARMLTRPTPFYGYCHQRAK